MPIKRIVLGTAQFGMKYGIANRSPKPSPKDIFNILEYAFGKGINALDTAYSYGNSEQLIGDFIAQSGNYFKIISKLPNLSDKGISDVEKYFHKTLNNLKQPALYGYLIHKFDNLIENKEIWGILESLKQDGLVEKIGVSLYNVSELEYLLNNNIKFDIVQIPYNIFDQRFKTYFSVLKNMKAEIHSRSVFLQGLFFLETDIINKDFQLAKDNINKLRRISIDNNIPLFALCLCFVLLNPFLDKVIIGVDSVEQLRQNIDSFEYLDKTKNIYDLLESLKLDYEEVIIPNKWK
ncbi:MAG: aldo/keto reductase [Candidatus Omnitrophica bacterium]|nr:aldo/keto reductase [Candidatus Omnitrophota bacterium]MDD5352401.1 aldo/keto reductase [Candidatus Omnitrophota bacterium]MDD5549999.1 aldo/keto reductase [Candidatus Omnitrophota bacterium]